MAAKKTTIEYRQICEARVSDTRKVMISECIKGGEPAGYTLAQQLEVHEGDKPTTVFLKGAIHVSDLERLYNLRDAINIAINEIENPEAVEDNWDDEE